MLTPTHLKHKLPVAIPVFYFVLGMVFALPEIAALRFMHEVLNIAPGGASTLMSTGATPWVFKVVYGLISDSFPIAGRRRQPYLVLFSLVSGCFWLLLPATRSVPATLATLVTIETSLCFCDVMADSTIVERVLDYETDPKEQGKLQATMWSIRNAGSILGSLLSGVLVDALGPAGVFYCTGGCMLVVFGTACTYKDRYVVHPRGCDPRPMGLFNLWHRKFGNVGLCRLVCCPLWCLCREPTLAVPRRAEMFRITEEEEDGDGGSGSGSGSDSDSGEVDTAQLLARSAEQDQVTAWHAGFWARVGTGCRTMKNTLLRAWRVFRTPDVFRPTCFAVLMQVMPSPGPTLAYFFMDELGFRGHDMSIIGTSTALAMLLGTQIYKHTRLRTMSFRRVFLITALFDACTSWTALVLIFGINRVWGIEDVMFAVMSSSVEAVMDAMAMMPVLILTARLCEKGIEGTLYSALVGMQNGGKIISRWLGASIATALGITNSNYEGLWILVVVCTGASLLPLLLLPWLVPATLRPRHSNAA